MYQCWSIPRIWRRFQRLSPSWQSSTCSCVERQKNYDSDTQLSTTALTLTGRDATSTDDECTTDRVSSESTKQFIHDNILWIPPNHSSTGHESQQAPHKASTLNFVSSTTQKSSTIDKGEWRRRTQLEWEFGAP